MVGGCPGQRAARARGAAPGRGAWEVLRCVVGHVVRCNEVGCVLWALAARQAVETCLTSCDCGRALPMRSHLGTMAGRLSRVLWERVCWTALVLNVCLLDIFMLWNDDHVHVQSGGMTAEPAGRLVMDTGSTTATTTTSTTTSTSSPEAWITFIWTTTERAPTVCNCAFPWARHTPCWHSCVRCWWPNASAPWLDGVNYWNTLKSMVCIYGRPSYNMNTKAEERCDCDCSLSWAYPSWCYDSCSHCSWTATPSWPTSTTATSSTTTITGRTTPWPTYSGDCPCWLPVQKRCVFLNETSFQLCSR